MGWFYKEGDQEFGPVSKEELQELIKDKKINGRTPVRSTEMNEWRALADMVRPKSAPPQPPPSAIISEQTVEESPQPQTTASETDRVEAVIAETHPPSADTFGSLEEGAPSAPRKIQFQFSGTGGEYFKIWIVNVLLSVITLGIYSAWAKVRRKQYFYGNTVIEGSSFQYVANPVLILKGRIIAFVVFIGFSILSGLFPVVNLIFTALLIFVLPWAVIRSLAFNAHNSLFRNIRFHFRGTYKEALKVFTLWPILVPFTLGALGPYVFYRQQKFLVEHSAFGQTQFTFDARIGSYYRMFFIFALHVIVAGVIIALFGLISMRIVPVGILLVYLYAFAYFTVKSTNLLYNSSMLAKNRFASVMAIKEYFLITFINTLGIIATVGLFHPVAQVRAFKYKIASLSLMAAGDLAEFTAVQERQVSAVGGEISEFMDFDFGF
jgi:uncharacterized membrane protein YjgN (DUF898 family)